MNFIASRKQDSQLTVLVHSYFNILSLPSMKIISLLHKVAIF